MIAEREAGEEELGEPTHSRHVPETAAGSGGAVAEAVFGVHQVVHKSDHGLGEAPGTGWGAGRV